MRPLLLLICGGTAAVVAIHVERRGAGIEAVPSCVAGAARRRGGCRRGGGVPGLWRSRRSAQTQTQRRRPASLAQPARRRLARAGTEAVASGCGAAGAETVGAAVDA